MKLYQILDITLSKYESSNEFNVGRYGANREDSIKSAIEYFNREKVIF